MANNSIQHQGENTNTKDHHKHNHHHRIAITSSKSIIETVNGSHHFSIKGYSLAKGIGPGKYISSDTFKVGGYNWAVYFYPDGKNPEDNSMYVSVFIALASEGTDVRALFQLELMDQSGKGKHKVHSHFDRALESGPYSLKYRGSMWGYKRFFKRTLLETSDYIKDDCLSMHCTVGVVRTRVDGPKHKTIHVPPSNMGYSMKNLLESEVNCDIVFQVHDEEFKAHKLILAARSPVFRAQFFGLVGNPSMDKVVVEDIEPSIFKAMLLFIYSDKLPEVHEITGSTMSMGTSTNMMQHLLSAADRFNLDRLKLLCEAKLGEEVNISTVASTLALAEQHGCSQLKAICLKFATNPSYLGAVMQTEGYKYLEASSTVLISEILRTFAEVDVSVSQQLTTKRGSSSSILGLEFDAEGAMAEYVNPNGRRTRRRR